MKEKKYAGFIMQILVSRGGYAMQYVKMVKMSIEEAKRRCKKNAIILVATQDLEDDDIDVVFIPKKEMNMMKYLRT